MAHNNTSTMSLGKRGADLIKEYETLRLTAYMPTPNDKPTIGWGSTRNVKLGMTITLEQAEERFANDTRNAVLAVQRLPCKLSQSMFDALVSLVFNVGASCISATSTIGKALRANDYYGAWAGFTLWRKQRNHKTKQLENLLGLARRRGKEMVLFTLDPLP